MYHYRRLLSKLLPIMYTAQYIVHDNSAAFYIISNSCTYVCLLTKFTVLGMKDRSLWSRQDLTCVYNLSTEFTEGRETPLPRIRLTNLTYCLIYGP